MSETPRDRHDAISRHFAAARRVPPAERAAYLDDACAGDPELRREIAALLDAHDEPTSQLDPERMRDQLAALASSALADGRLAASRPLPERIGPFRIVRLIGEGGMGTVYEAEQDDPRRRVALKVIRPDRVSREMLRRFRHEAQILGQLRHPGIAAIHQAGTTDDGSGGRPYFAMELVTGANIIEHAAQRDLSVRDRLALIAATGDALQHAHQKGVIHRDLKPANILIDDHGTIAQPKILDFGVARLTDIDVSVATLHTTDGQIVGTMPYMSPEQAAGDRAAIDTRSDVYALGVIMFEVLSGTLPYDLEGLPIHEAVRVIHDTPPTRLSAHDRRLRGDVETIVRTALAKAPAERYPSAAEFAADIRRALNDAPILARPPSTAYQLRKFVRRHRALTAAAVVVVAALIVATAVSMTQVRQTNVALRTAQFERAFAEAEAYRATLAAATAALESGDVTTATQLLDGVAPERRGLEWSLLSARLDGSRARLEFDAPVVTAALRHDAGHAVVVTRDGRVRIVAADAHRIVSESTLPITPIENAAFSRDGTRVIVRSGARAMVADLGRDGLTTLVEFDAESIITNVALAADGSRAVLQSFAATWLWVEDESALRRIAPGGKFTLALSADGSSFATTIDRPGDHFTLHCADLDAPDEPRLAHDYRDMRWAGISPDGAFVATCGLDKRIRLRDRATLSVQREFIGHTSPARQLTFSGDGTWLASGALDRTVRLWDIRSGLPGPVFTGHDGPVTEVRFADDDRALLTVSDGALRVWSLDETTGPTILRGHRSYAYSVAFAADGLLVSGDWAGDLLAWDADGGARLLHRRGLGRVNALTTTTDGALIIGGLARGRLALWDGATLAPRAEAIGMTNVVLDVAVDAAGTRIAGIDRTGTLAVWSIDALDTPLLRHSDVSRRQAGVALAPDGRAVVRTAGRAVVVLDVDTGQERWRATFTTETYTVAWSPDGATVAIGRHDGVVELRDARTGTLTHTCAGHSSIIYALRFSPDGTRLASGSNDTTVRLWTLPTGAHVATLRGHSDYVFDLAFDPDGSRLASASGDRDVRIWDTRPAHERTRARAQLRDAMDAQRSFVESLYADGLDHDEARRAIAESELTSDEQRAARRVALERYEGAMTDE